MTTPLDASSPEPTDEPGVGLLIVRYLDGVIGDGEAQRLRDELNRSDDAVAMLMALSVQRRVLRESLQRSASVSRMRSESAAARPAAAPVAARIGRPRWVGPTLTLAAALAVVAAVWIVTALIEPTPDGPSVAADEPVGMVTLLDGVVFGDDTDPIGMGQSLTARSVSLTAGSMELVTNAGVSVSLDGPGQYTLTGPMRAAVTRGTMIATAPPNLSGFTVAAPGLRIKDIGTEFGVHVRHDGSTDLEVFEGTVEVTVLDASGAAAERRELNLWQSIRFTPGEAAELIDVSPADSYFADRRMMRAGHPGLSRTGRPAEPIRLAAATLRPYSDQDGFKQQPTSAELIDGGLTLRLTGNAWRSIAIDYDVTPRTVLEFDLRAERAGEMVGVGIDDDNDHQTGGGLFAIGGQSRKVDPLRFDYYRGDVKAWRTYRIPIGRDFTGDARQLVLFADDDAKGDAAAEFRGLRLYESTDDEAGAAAGDTRTHEDGGSADDPRPSQKGNTP